MQFRNSAPGRQEKQQDSTRNPSELKFYSQRSSQKVASNNLSQTSSILSNRKSQVFQDVENRKVPQRNLFISTIVLVGSFFYNLVILLVRVIKFLVLEPWRLLKKSIKCAKAMLNQAQGSIKLSFILFLMGFILLTLPVGLPIRDYLFQLYSQCTNFILRVLNHIMAYQNEGILSQQGIY